VITRVYREKVNKLFLCFIVLTYGDVAECEIFMTLKPLPLAQIGQRDSRKQFYRPFVFAIPIKGNPSFKRRFLLQGKYKTA
jgi:hypothetical protein